jgi:hypothetical protein
MSLPFDPWTGYAILLLSDITIFLVIILDLTLLKPQRVRPTIWIGPLISLYVLGSILFTMFLAFAAFSPSALVNYGAVVVSSLVGAIVGTEIGKEIPLTGRTDGSKWYTGGKVLVVILVVMLLPRAIEQAALIVSTFYQSGTVVSTVAGSPIVATLDSITGSLVFFGVFLSIGWRYQVQRRQTLYAGKASETEMKSMDPATLWKVLLSMVRPDQIPVLDAKMRRMPLLEIAGAVFVVAALVVTIVADILSVQGSAVQTYFVIIMALLVVGLLIIFASLSTDEHAVDAAKKMAMEQHPEFFAPDGQFSELGMSYVQGT